MLFLICEERYKGIVKLSGGKSKKYLTEFWKYALLSRPRTAG